MSHIAAVSVNHNTSVYGTYHLCVRFFALRAENRTLWSGEYYAAAGELLPCASPCLRGESKSTRSSR